MIQKNTFGVLHIKMPKIGIKKLFQKGVPLEQNVQEILSKNYIFFQIFAIKYLFKY
jgi:hypothetical protein